MPPSDGCTGWQWAEALLPIRQCCEIHDASASLPDAGDPALVQCLMQHTPGWVWPVVLIAVGLTLLLRPLYRLIRPVR